MHKRREKMAADASQLLIPQSAVPNFSKALLLTSKIEVKVVVARCDALAGVKREWPVPRAIDLALRDLSFTALQYIYVSCRCCRADNPHRLQLLS